MRSPLPVQSIKQPQLDLHSRLHNLGTDDIGYEELTHRLSGANAQFHRQRGWQTPSSRLTDRLASRTWPVIEFGPEPLAQLDIESSVVPLVS